jgi:hypothetical protein
LILYKVENIMKKIISGLLVLSLSVLVGCAAGGPPPGVGVWDIEMNTPLGALPAVLTINEDGSGSMDAEALGDTPFSGVTFDGNTMAFTGEIDAQGQTLVLEFEGSVEGDALVGAFESDFGAFDVTGTRQ